MSSSTIVPIPCAPAMLALTAPERFTVNVLLDVSTELPITGTVTICVTTPGAYVSVPDCAV